MLGTSLGSGSLASGSRPRTTAAAPAFGGGSGIIAPRVGGAPQPPRNPDGSYHYPAPSPPITTTPPYGILPGNPQNPAVQPNTNPSGAAQWLASQMGLTNAQADQANQDLMALYAAQAAALGGGGGGGGGPGLPPNWQLMKDKLLAALKNVQGDVKSGQVLAGASEKAAKNKYGGDFALATTDATVRGAVTSRGYGQNLKNAANSRDQSLAQIRRDRDQLALSLLSGTQAYNFGLADIADQQKRWAYNAAHSGGGGGGNSGQQGVLLAQQNAGINANNAAAINAQAGYINQAVANGWITPAAGSSMLNDLYNPQGPAPKPAAAKPPKAV